MNCVVLEPDGRHWAVELSEAKLGQPFEKAERDGNTAVYDLELVRYVVVTYEGHQIMDKRGHRYWVYTRT